MGIDKWISFSGIIICLVSYFFKKNKILRWTLFLVGLFFVLGATTIINLFGKVDAIAMIKEEKISKIILQPSSPEWKVNLTSSVFVDTSKTEVEYIVGQLRKAEFYTNGHSAKIWETTAILITENKDSFFLKIDKAPYQGTGIYSMQNAFRNDELGEYLEKITGFKEADYSDRYKNQVGK